MTHLAVCPALLARTSNASGTLSFRWVADAKGVVRIDRSRPELYPSRAFDGIGCPFVPRLERSCAAAVIPNAHLLKSLSRCSKGSQGIAADHFVEIDLGRELTVESRPWLVASGWIYPTDRSINVAIGQAQKVQPHGLSPEAHEPSGLWAVLAPDLVFPACHTNPVFVEVDGKPIRASKKSAQWCVDAVETCWKKKEPATRKEEKAAAKSAYDAASEAYTKILAQAHDDTK